jgi:hypothetical protein
MTTSKPKKLKAAKPKTVKPKATKPKTNVKKVAKKPKSKTDVKTKGLSKFRRAAGPSTETRKKLSAHMNKRLNPDSPEFDDYLAVWNQEFKKRVKNKGWVYKTGDTDVAQGNI